ncbi:MAG: DUF3800 domain-containing protein [bacterium]
MLKILRKENNNLNLSDYKQIWTKFCFLDESGSLNDSQSPFFTVGLLKCTQPYYLYSALLYERNKRQFHDELKFNKMSKNKLEFSKFAMESFLNTKSIHFYSYSIDKSGDYFKREFNSNPWIAYEQLSIRLIEAALAPNEILIVMADHVTTPKNIRYEVNVKRRINDKEKRLAIAGVCRLDSKSSDLFQVVDLFIGAINYDLKKETGIIGKGDKYKHKFLEFFKENLGADNFVGGFKNYQFNIFIDKDIRQRLPLNFAQNEKKPSS